MKASFTTLIAWLVLTSQAQAFRNAQFPAELKAQATIFTRQEDFFKNEPVALQNRPVWIHGGDSIAVGWGSRSTLRERIEGEAVQGDLPAPSTLNDFLLHLPSTLYSWHSGSAIDFGLMGWLKKETQQDWVIDSTALAGTRFDQDDFDPVALMIQAAGKSRTRLVTFSLGSNDLCDIHNPLDNPEAFNQRLTDLKKAFPARTAIVPWAVPQLKMIHDSVMARIEKLPDSAAKTRIKDYCEASWKNHCDVVNKLSQAEIDAIRTPLNKAFEDHFGPVFDFSMVASMPGVDTLDVMSSDCFHPSRLAQTPIYQAFGKHLKDRYHDSAVFSP